MSLRKALCLLLTVVLLMTLFPSFFRAPEKAAALGWIEGISVASNIVSIVSGGFSIAKFFGLNDPSADTLAKLDAIGKTLDRVEQTVNAIWTGINVLYKELEKTKLATVMAKAWGQTGFIDSNFQQLNAAYANAASNPADFQSQKAAFNNWYPSIPAPMDTAIQDFYNALVKVMPGADECALDIVTDAAIVECNTNTNLQDFSATVESTNGVPIVAERPVYFAFNNEWTGGHTEAGAAGAGTKFYFAEGTTRPGFETYFCLANPGDTRTDVKLTYMKVDGSTASQLVSIPPHTRSTAKPSDVIGVADDISCDFSTLVESTNGVGFLAERPSYFNYRDEWEGGSTDNGCAEPAEEFFFAEGTTRPGFDTYFCIMNPGDGQADVQLTYMRGDGGVLEDHVSLAPRSRFTVKANDLLGSADDLSSDFSTRVNSSNGAPIVVERPMYFTYKGESPGGHCETGITDAGLDFYLAEGTTRPGFDSYLTIMNPEKAAADVNITYMRGDGTSMSHSLAVAPASRSTVKVNDLLGSDDSEASDFSAQVTSINGVSILVERPMYFEYHRGIDGGSCEPGQAQAATSFSFAEGCVRDGFDTYFCLLNPGDSPARVRITYIKGDGTAQEQLVDVPARRRVTVSVDQVYTAANDLMSVYKKYLESLFWGSYTYQVMAARMTCDALDKDKTLLAYNVDGKGYMNTRFLPKIAEPEVDTFLSCAERLVMSRVTLGPENMTDPRMSDPGFKLDDQSPAVLEEANKVAMMALGEKNGLRGTVFSTEAIGRLNVTVRGIPPVTSSFNPTTTEVRAVPYTPRRADGLGVEARAYPNWSNLDSSAEVNTSGVFTATRHKFLDVNEAGTYDVFDTEGRLSRPGDPLTRTPVVSSSVEDPSNPGKQININYGHFLYAFGNRLSGEPLSDFGYVTSETSGYGYITPYDQYRYAIWAPGNGTAATRRTFTYTGSTEKKATINAFFLTHSTFMGTQAPYYSAGMTHVGLYLLDNTDHTNTAIYKKDESYVYGDFVRTEAASIQLTLKPGHSYEILISGSASVNKGSAGVGILLRNVYLTTQ